MKTPTIFVSHGAPTLLLDKTPTNNFLKNLGKSIDKPSAIICISAHWETSQPMVTFSENPKTIYDFYGFPDELYKVQYPAPGNPVLAEKVITLLKEAGFHASGDTSRGLDHGAWVPLKLMYPNADVPIVQLSVQSHLGAEHHFKMGRALSSLRDEGVLILGSGGATHNLREFGLYSQDAQPVEYAKQFDNWLAKNILEANTKPLLNYLEEGPHARRNHPTPEHFLPLFVPLGATGNSATGRLLHSAIEYGILSMAAFAWE